MSALPTLRLGLASSDLETGHIDLLSAASGTPRPQPLPCAGSHWIELNQSPESKELASSDLERSRSLPAWAKPTPWFRAVNDSPSACIRARSAGEVVAGSLNARASNRSALSCASRYSTDSPGFAAYPVGEPL